MRQIVPDFDAADQLEIESAKMDSQFAALASLSRVMDY